MLAARERFKALCTRLGARDNPKTGRTIDTTYDELFAAYTGPDRHYHDIGHISDGLGKLDEVRHLAECPDYLEMAWWFHDFVYDTRSKVNEYNSALLADRILWELGVQSAIRNIVVWLIMATKHDHVPANRDQRLIIDIDLVSLALPPEEFDKMSEKIRLEYNIPVEMYRIGRANFFKKMLENRPSIYLTKYFREKYEAQAQENLKRTIAILNR